jgi:hypothetical protein
MIDTRRILQLALTLCLSLLAPSARAGGFDLSIHGGLDKYDAVGLKSGLGGVSKEGRLQDVSTHVGATAIFRGGLLELGAIGEVGRPGSDGATTLFGALAGLGLDLGSVRLEALGELGAHRYGDLFHDPGVVTRSESEAWLVSLGLRPGLSLRFGPQNMLLAGVWAFARWDLTSKDVQVNLGSGESTYKLGGSQFGMALRLGFSL